MQRWSYRDQRYEPYSVPNGWNVKLYGEDMTEKINCAGCGKEVLLGETYTSKTIHNAVGLGYCVCSGCYDKEWEQIREAARNEG